MLYGNEMNGRFSLFDRPESCFRELAGSPTINRFEFKLNVGFAFAQWKSKFKREGFIGENFAAVCQMEL